MADAISSGNGDTRPKESNAPRIRRRNRMITSCLECRRRKLKCDKLHPCTNCSKFSRECMFLAPALDSVSQRKLNELKDKMGSLEKVLENDLARKGNVRHTSPTERGSPGNLPGEDDDSEDDIGVPEDEKTLEPTPLAVTDAAYEDNGSEDLLDLGVRIGRMRLTERFGGTFRPRFAEEVGASLGEPINTNMADPNVKRLSDHEDFLAPGPTFIAPGSGFLFGDVGPRRNLIDFLPSKSAADSMVRNYYQRVHFVARVLHWPSFQLQYESFWNNVLSGYEPQPSLQSVVFSVLFSATASMDQDDVYTLFGSDKATVLMNFQTATEVALAKAHFLRTAKIETLQALVIYLISMIRDEISRAHSVLVGSAIRLGECMGLHRDPEVFGMSPVGTHVRRTLWFQLCYLDFRTAETQAPRHCIKREDYDTRFPLDVNDLDLMIPDPTERGGAWTDMTMSRMRFECTEMWRVITNDAERLRQKKISITHALGKAESFRRAMEAKYHPIMDTKVPLQAYAKHFLHSAMSRMHVAILHRFHHSVHVQIPDRLREILIINAIEAMENFITIQRTVEFAKWHWYSTSVTTWNPAMLLLLEVFVFPQRREADRIWAILDYTFQPDAGLSRDEKARQILRTIRDRAAYYRDMRRIREPLYMPPHPVLSIRTAGSAGSQRTGAARADLMLLKQEDNDVPLHRIQSAGGSPPASHSRKQSLNGHMTEVPIPASPPKPQQAPNDSWTFDSQSTLFMPRLVPSTGTMTTSRISSMSPVPQLNAGHTLLQQGLGQSINQIPGLDASTSPGSTSSSIENWPPPITQDQHDWRSRIPPQQQRTMSQSIEHRMSGMSNPIGELPGTITVPGYPPGQLPLLANNQTGIEAMLQPAQPAVVPEDSMSLDIDWGEWDKIFPPAMNTGNLNHPNTVGQ